MKSLQDTSSDDLPQLPETEPEEPVTEPGGMEDVYLSPDHPSLDTGMDRHELYDRGLSASAHSISSGADIVKSYRRILNNEPQHGPVIITKPADKPRPSQS